MSLIGWLGKATSPCKWVGAHGLAHLVVLSVLHVGPVGHWLLLMVVSLRNPSRQLFIIVLLKSSPGAVLHNELLITLVERDIDVILGLHLSTTDSVLVLVFLDVIGLLSGLKVAGLSLEFLLMLFLSHLLGDFAHDLERIKSVGDFPR